MNEEIKITPFQPDTIVVDTPAVNMEEVISDTVTEGDAIVQETRDSTISVTVTSTDSVSVENVSVQTQERTIQVVETAEPVATLPVFDPPEEILQHPAVDTLSVNFLKKIPGFSNKVTERSDLLTGSTTAQTLALNKPAIIPKTVPDWAMIIIILSSFFLIWVRRFYDKYVGLILRSFGNYQFSVKLFKDSSQIYHQVSYLLNINSAIIVGLFLFQAYNYFIAGPNETPRIINYLFIPLLLLGLYVLQHIGYYLLGLFFEQSEPYMEYTHHTYTLTKILGILFLPLVIIVAYIPDAVRPVFIWAGLFTLFIFYLKRLFRGVKIIINHHAFKFQWILYFCTLEILPVLIIIKLAITLI